jgi:segregation and condensation protein A
MSDYRVNLDTFAGPLDLLLYLVRKEEVDIYDIPIAKVTDQYLRYIEMLQNLDIDLAGDFLVMASTLMQIKSAMLLPKTDAEQLQGEDLNDPRAELIRQLLEYKKFKDAANLLEAAAEVQNEKFSRPDTIIEQLKPSTEPEIDLEQVSIWDLLEAFDLLMAATGGTVNLNHIKDDTPIDFYQVQILQRLQKDGPMSFERIFEPRTSRIVLVSMFLALLELIRDKLAWAEQPEDSETIFVKALTDEPAEQAVQKAILSSVEVQQQTEVEKQTPSREPPIPIAEIPPENHTTDNAPEYENIPVQQDLPPSQEEI